MFGRNTRTVVLVFDLSMHYALLYGGKWYWARNICVVFILFSSVAGVPNNSQYAMQIAMHDLLQFYRNKNHDCNVRKKIFCMRSTSSIPQIVKAPGPKQSKSWTEVNFHFKFIFFDFVDQIMFNVHNQKFNQCNVLWIDRFAKRFYFATLFCWHFHFSTKALIITLSIDQQTRNM